MFVRIMSKSSFINPPTITLLVSVILVAGVILFAGGDPLSLVRVGTQFDQGDNMGTEGYDGQFIYYIAQDINPTTVAKKLDRPSYRYQRVLLPIIAHILSLGNIKILPWLLVAIVVVSHFLGTWAVSKLLEGWGINTWYGLVYGLWVGFLLSIRLILPETLAYGLIAGGFLAYIQKRYKISGLLFGLGLFAKEVTILFVCAALLDSLFRRKWRVSLYMMVFSILPYTIFQGFLWSTFGNPGFGSGGAMATPFELIPFMGLFRIGSYSTIYLVAMLVVFGPSIVLPVMWGLWASIKHLISGDVSIITFSLLTNAIVIPFLPFSTFRETGGILRLSSGLVLAVLLFAGYYRYRKVTNYCALWLVLNTFLFK